VEWKPAAAASLYIGMSCYDVKWAFCATQHTRNKKMKPCFLITLLINCTFITLTLEKTAHTHC
jgi:heme/copper-type cytochrome/quinol oxidase subunit 3